MIDDHGAARKNALMLYLAYPAPHTPWLPSERFAGKSSWDDDLVMMVDTMIDHAYRSDRNGLTDDTLVFFSSDNRPVWYESDRERFALRRLGNYVA